MIWLFNLLLLLTVIDVLMYYDYYYEIQNMSGNSRMRKRTNISFIIPWYNAFVNVNMFYNNKIMTWGLMWSKLIHLPHLNPNYLLNFGWIYTKGPKRSRFSQIFHIIMLCKQYQICTRLSAVYDYFSSSILFSISHDIRLPLPPLAQRLHLLNIYICVCVCVCACVCGYSRFTLRLVRFFAT